MLARLQLTEEEDSFYRLIMYRVVSDHTYGQPYLKRAFNRLIPASVEGSRTMAVDANWYVYVDFEEMMTRGVDYAAGIMNHEIWHLLRRHHKAMEYLPPAPKGYKKEKLANLAADLEINDDIADLLPVTAVKPERSIFRKYKEGQSLTDYYSQMLHGLDELAENFDIEHQGRPDSKKQDEPSDDSELNSDEAQKNEEDESPEKPSGEPSKDGEPSQDKGNPKKGEGASQSDGDRDNEKIDSNGEEGSDGEGDRDEESESNKPSSGENDSSETGKEPSNAGKPSSPTTPNKPSPQPQKDFWQEPNCGGAAGNPQDYELDSLETDEQNEMTEGEEDAIIRKIASDIQDYKEEFPNGVGDGKSKMLARLSEWASDALRAKQIPWKQQLRGQFLQSYASTRGKLIYVRNRPARRQPVPDILYPALRSPKPTIGIGIDVSGSNLGNLKVILTELSNIMKAAGVRGKEVQAFAVDVAVSKVKFVNNPLSLLDDLPVGGGTRMAPGYRQLAEMGQNISILITDGHVYDYPKKKPEGRKRTKFITCIVMDEQAGKNDNRIAQAEKIMGEWCKIIPIYTSQLK